jgi:dTDP-glucose pyrophosphorylase
MIKYLISSEKKIKNIIKLLDSIHRSCLIVIDLKKHVIGTITDGDIRRALLRNKNINTKLKYVCNRNYLYFYKNYKIDHIKKIFLNKNNNIKIIPIIDENKKLIKVFTASSFDKKEYKYNKKLKSIKVVIMAGGKGKRLWPVTNVLPKPLIPIGENTLIENIMSKFRSQGLNRFLITVNFKKELIKAYFKDSLSNFNINFLEEKKPLGTAGSLFFLQKFKPQDYFVTNCDNIFNVDYGNIFEFHKEKKSDLTIVGNTKNINIPYGKIIISEKGQFLELKEKPKIKILINTGLYIIGKKVIKSVPRNTKIDMNQLISLCKSKGLKVDVYPIEDESWLDVGQWKEYKKLSKSIEL